jgi:hypothetical protein
MTHGRVLRFFPRGPRECFEPNTFYNILFGAKTCIIVPLTIKNGRRLATLRFGTNLVDNSCKNAMHVINRTTYRAATLSRPGQLQVANAHTECLRTTHALPAHGLVTVRSC